MTQPVQEPSQGRINQGLEFRSRQLFRRPSPPSGATTYRNSVTKYSTVGLEWKLTDYYATTGVSFVWSNADADNGGYAQIDGDEKYFVVGMPLGPAGSAWQVSALYLATPDGGQVVIDWQTTTVDPTYDFGTPILWPEALMGAEYPVGLGGPGTTYYQANNAVTTDFDCYAGVNTEKIFGSTWMVVPNGADGDMLSADGTSGLFDYSSVGTPFGMNGGGDGGVYWWMRVRVSGKHASSAGYKARIFALSVNRHDTTNSSSSGTF